MSLLTSLDLYYTMDEASAPRADSQGGANLSEPFGAVASAAGILGNAASFAGSTAMSRASDAAAQVTGSFFISCWVYVTNITANRDIVTKAGEYWLRYNNAFGQFDFLVRDSANTAYSEVFFGPTASANTWYHVVAWYDSVAQKIKGCVNDGTVSETAHAGGVLTGSGDFGIAYNGAAFVGLIDEVGKWSRVPTSDEVTSLYNGGAGLAYASFGGGSAALPPQSFLVRQAARRASTY